MDSPSNPSINRQNSIQENMPCSIHIRASGTLIEKYPAKQHALNVAHRLDVQHGLIYLPGSPTRLYEDSDQPRPFRQRRYFYYLSGVDEADCHLTYDIGRDSLTLYIPPINPTKVIWSGRGSTVPEAFDRYDVDKVRETTLLHEDVDKWMSSNPGDMYILHPSQALQPGDDKSKRVNYTKLQGATDSCRVIKDDHEIKMIKRANEISGKAHREVLEKIADLKNEAQVEAIFLDVCVGEDAKNQAYEVIAASGENAATLHYVKNDEPLEGRQLMVLDAGCEWQNYASDVTRTFPLDGKFSKEAIEIYNLVAKMQVECIGMLKPGFRFLDAHMAAHKIAVEGLLELGIFYNGTSAEILAAGTSRAFFPHGLGHHLGLEVHDVSGVPVNSHLRNEGLDPLKLDGDSLTEAQKHEQAEKSVFYLRHRLQKGFLCSDSKLQKEDMLRQYLGYLTHESLKDIDVGIIKRTKIDKVLKAILQLSISNEVFNEVKQRSATLLQTCLRMKETELYVSEDCRKPCTADSHGLEEGMIVTVEPGIYFSRYALSTVYLRDPVHSKFINKEVLERYLPVGGVRIEDDILITAKGYENLTTAPKGKEMLDVIRDSCKKKQLREYGIQLSKIEARRPTRLCMAYREPDAPVDVRQSIEKRVGFGTVSFESREQSILTDTEPTSNEDDTEQCPTTSFPPPLPPKAPLLPPKPLAYRMSVPDLNSTLGLRNKASPGEVSAGAHNRAPTRSVPLRHHSVIQPSGSISKDLHRTKSMSFLERPLPTSTDNTSSSVRKINAEPDTRLFPMRFLQRWLEQNVDNPYPTMEEESWMVRETGLRLAQIRNFFSNAYRQRNLPFRRPNLPKVHSEVTKERPSPYYPYIDLPLDELMREARQLREQVDRLEAVFQQEPKPSTTTKKDLANEMEVPVQKVNSWFQNRRAKSKQEARTQNPFRRSSLRKETFSTPEELGFNTIDDGSSAVPSEWPKPSVSNGCAALLTDSSTFPPAMNQQTQQLPSVILASGKQKPDVEPLIDLSTDSGPQYPSSFLSEFKNYASHPTSIAQDKLLSKATGCSSTPSTSQPFTAYLPPQSLFPQALNATNGIPFPYCSVLHQAVPPLKSVSPMKDDKPDGWPNKTNTWHVPDCLPSSKGNERAITTDGERDMGKLLRQPPLSGFRSGPIPVPTPRVVRQVQNGVQWIAFEYSHDHVTTEYTIRCDVESIDVNSLPQDWKLENAYYPNEQFIKLDEEIDCNMVGWALAQLNPCLRGKRDLIQRAVDCWWNTYQESSKMRREGAKGRKVSRISMIS